MNRPFRFKHTSELAGAFVLLATVLLVVAIVLAARAQGWFEGKSRLVVVFSTQEGSFGLQEGAEIRIRNTVAGRVGTISPTESGQMSTSFIIKNRFMPLVTKGSIAKVRKKFGVAGDAYVEIERGDGPPVADGDMIVCQRDEEIMETAQRVLDELRTTLLPIFEDAKEIVTHVKNILGAVDRGEGAAGSLIADTDMRDDLKIIVENITGITEQAQAVIEMAELFLEGDLREMGNGVTAVLADARNMLTNDVTKIADELLGLEKEANVTLRETRRLIKGVQRHWLFRKYIKEESDTVLLVPAAMSYLSVDGVREELAAALNASRLADDTAASASRAYNLAACHLARGEITEAMAFNEEARVAYRITGGNPVSTLLLEAEALRTANRSSAALNKVLEANALIGWSVDRETKVEAGLIKAAIHCDLREIDEARLALKKIKSKLRKTEQPRLEAAASGMMGRILLCEGDPQGAAAQFLEKAAHLRSAAAYRPMAEALKASAEAYGVAVAHAEEGELYYRAAASFHAQNDTDAAMECLAGAVAAAKAAGDDLLLKQAERLQRQM